MVEATEVERVDGGPRLTGGTPCKAPYLANELAHALLDQLPHAVEPIIRCSFTVQSLLTFSWELDARCIDRLAKLGARLEFFVNDPNGAFARFECCECIVAAGEHDVTSEPPIDIATLFAQLPVVAGAKRVDLRLHVDALCGGIRLAAPTVAKLAAYEAPFGVFFFNMGA